jgi:hypothetical protein
MQGDSLLALGLFDEPDALPLASEIYIDRKPSAYAFAGERPRATKAEVEAMLGAVVVSGSVVEPGGLAQRGVHARLPAAAAGLEVLDDVGVEHDGDAALLPLGRQERAAALADERGEVGQFSGISSRLARAIISGVSSGASSSSRWERSSSRHRPGTTGFECCLFTAVGLSQADDRRGRPRA